MNQTVVFKHSFSVALLTMERFLAPAVVGVAMLWVTTRVHGVTFGPHFVLLSVLVAILAPIVLQQPPVTSTQLVGSQWSRVGTLLLRWTLLLGILFAIGNITTLSDEFPRRVLVTWAIVSQVVLALAVIDVIV